MLINHWLFLVQYTFSDKHSERIGIHHEAIAHWNWKSQMLPLTPQHHLRFVENDLTISMTKTWNRHVIPFDSGPIFWEGGCCERHFFAFFEFHFCKRCKTMFFPKPNIVASATKTTTVHSLYFSQVIHRYIHRFNRSKHDQLIDKHNKTNKCKCLCKECSIALIMYRLYISTGVSLNICKSSFKHVHSKQAPIHAICSLQIMKEKQTYKP